MTIHEMNTRMIARNTKDDTDARIDQLLHDDLACARLLHDALNGGPRLTPEQVEAYLSQPLDGEPDPQWGMDDETHAALSSWTIARFAWLCVGVLFAAGFLYGLAWGIGL